MLGTGWTWAVRLTATVRERISVLTGVICALAPLWLEVQVLAWPSRLLFSPCWVCRARAWRSRSSSLAPMDLPSMPPARAPTRRSPDLPLPLPTWLPISTPAAAPARVPMFSLFIHSFCDMLAQPAERPMQAPRTRGPVFLSMRMMRTPCRLGEGLEGIGFLRRREIKQRQQKRLKILIPLSEKNRSDDQGRLELKSYWQFNGMFVSCDAALRCFSGSTESHQQPLNLQMRGVEGIVAPW